MRNPVVRMIVVAAMVVAPIAGVTSVALSQPAAAATRSPINIGDIASLTGPEASSIDQTTEVLEAWAKTVNAKGGLQGHPVNLIVKDDGYNPATSLAEVESLVTGNHIVALIDNSDVDTSWYSYVEQNKVPVIGGQTEDGPYENADFFDPGSTFNDYSYGEAYLTKLVHSKATADLYCAEVALCSEALGALRAEFPKFGSKLVYTSAISFAAPSYAAQCLAAKQAGATSMTVGDATQVVNKVVQDCAAQGYTPIQLSADGTVGISWLTIPQFNGNVDAQPDVPFFVHNSATDPMYTALKKYYPAQLDQPQLRRDRGRELGGCHPAPRRDRRGQAGVDPNAGRGDRRHVRPPAGHHAGRSYTAAPLQEGQAHLQRLLLLHGDQERQVRRAQEHPTAHVRQDGNQVTG